VEILDITLNMFLKSYKVNSLTHVGKKFWNHGGKIILSESASEELFSQEITFPIQFELSHNNKKTHCGVWEFTAKENYCYLPEWMMKMLNLKENDLVEIKNVSLPKATFIKFNPHNILFLQLEDPKSILEHYLPEYTCLTIGDTIVINHMDTEYYLDVVELKPETAVLINETNCELEFQTNTAKPISTKPLEKKNPSKFSSKNCFIPFSGTGHKLN
jgi:ubiquitin fusion degradation protein 1